MTVLRLYLEEMRALPRARFALAGAASFAALLTFLAAVVATGPAGVFSFGILAYAMAPALLAGVAAAHTSGPRTTRFTHSLFTAPVRKGELLAAKVLVSLTVAAAHLLATTPFLAVAARHVGVPAHVPDFLLLGAGVALFAVALGTLLGVLFTGRSGVAPVALSVGFLVLSLFAVPFAGGLHERPGGADPALMRVLHLSPHLLLSDAVGLWEHDAGLAAESPARAAAIVLAESLALLALAAWAYLREQGVEGWESTPARRVLLGALVALTLLAPGAAADVGYERRETALMPMRMAWGDDRNGTVLLVASGTPAGDVTFGDFFAGTFDEPLDAGRANARDVLVLLRLPAGAALSEVRATLVGREGLSVSLADERRPGELAAPETGRRAGADAGQAGGTGPVVRIPATFTPGDPDDLGGNFYSARVVLAYRLAGESAPREVTIDFPVRADVPGAALQMTLAGLPLVLVPATAAVLRRIRVG